MRATQVFKGEKRKEENIRKNKNPMDSKPPLTQSKAVRLQKIRIKKGIEDQPIERGPFPKGERQSFRNRMRPRF
jgi:hypothetical protein